jgi:hypothetical protein
MPIHHKKVEEIGTIPTSLKYFLEGRHGVLGDLSGENDGLMPFGFSLPFFP